MTYEAKRAELIRKGLIVEISLNGKFLFDIECADIAERDRVLSKVNVEAGERAKILGRL